MNISVIDKINENKGKILFFLLGVFSFFLTGGMLILGTMLFCWISIFLLRVFLSLFKKQEAVFPFSHYPIVAKKLSIIIPAYNEEKRIAITMQEVHEAAKNTLDDFEIIVVDDGSRDQTYSVAKSMAHNLGRKVQVISHEINKGVGEVFHLGLRQASFPQLCLIPGDNAFNKAGIELLFAHCGKSPLVISNRKNMEVRTPLRYLLSRTLTIFLGIITGAKISDAHGIYLFPVAETRSLGVKASGYGYHVEILSRLLRRLKSFSEVPVDLNPKPDASSGVMKPKTLLIFGLTLGKLFLLRLINFL